MVVGRLVHVDAAGVSINSGRLVGGRAMRGFIVDGSLLLVGMCSDVTEDSLREDMCEERILAFCQLPMVQMKNTF